MTLAPYCISAEVHDRLPGTEDHKISDVNLDPRRVSNLVIHYFGCLEFCERETYFKKLDALNQDLIRDQLRRVNRLKLFVAKNCTRQSDSDGTTRDSLVKNVQTSFANWRGDLNGANATRWGAVQKHRLGRRKHCPPNCNVDFDPIEDPRKETVSGASNGVEGVTPGQRSSQSSSSHATRINGQHNSDQLEYNPDKDVKGYLIQYKIDNLNDTSNVLYTGEDLIELGRSPDNGEIPWGQGGDPEQQRRAVWMGTFPGQKAIVYDLLQRPVDENSQPGENYMSRDYQRGDPQRLRYFHFPANNMKWVEDAMSRYYNEKDVQFNNGQPNAIPITPTRANTVLCHELWKGQQHLGNTSFIHARHLRPLCELVSSGEKNRRDQTAEWEATDQRRKEMGDLLKEIGINLDDTGPPKREGTFRNIDTFQGAVVAQSRKRPSLFPKRRTVTRDESGRLRLKNSLAQLLYDAFRLMEEMENYRDNMMLETYLHHSPPLHPRRTLDQAYYCSVKSTRSRDRDQVVYRETTPKEDSLHSWDYGKNGKVVWNCNGSDGIPKRCLADINNMDLYARKYTKLKTRCPICASAKRHRLDWKRQRVCPRDDEITSGDSDNGPGDEKISNVSDKELKGKTGCKLCGSAALICECKKVILKDENGKEHFFPTDLKRGSKPNRQCPRCHDNIRKLSRLVMVDQLWMWILDERTILTFLPEEIWVQQTGFFDLALVILSKCTKTFFDRTKTADQQPRVLDMFSEAIGRVTHNQTLAFNHMWESAEKLRHASSAPSTADLSDLHIPLLNIAPEGMLQCEIKDILDELSIMIHLVEQQRDVLRKFAKNAASILSEGKGTRRERSKKKKWFELSAQELLSDVDGHLLELDILKQSATRTSEGLDQLLTLKQQQASVIQAWQSIRYGEEAVKQGRAIMIFTTMTIVFLPLAFIAAIFGMNNPELDPEVQETKHRRPMSLWMQLKLMYLASLESDLEERKPVPAR
ncbi:hypothetical protein DL769_000139 [Monosporascus sp. CRB-8-3]|nr:hypothetical protein DL769_000139 [Monosporascus sp. CRB-8-3]